ncbi:MAG: hypothetical protein U0166_11775 [Acidobacteriota bacterium]
MPTRSWEAENGKRSITEVIVDRFEFLSPKNGNGSNGNGSGHGQAQAADASDAVASDASESVGYEDLADVPF